MGARWGRRARRVDQDVVEERAATTRVVFRASLPRGIQKPFADAPAPRPKEPVATCLRFFLTGSGVQASGARPRGEDRCRHGHCWRAVRFGVPREWRISCHGAFPFGLRHHAGVPLGRAELDTRRMTRGCGSGWRKRETIACSAFAMRAIHIRIGAGAACTDCGARLGA